MELKWIYITSRHTLLVPFGLEMLWEIQFFMKTMGLEEEGQTVDYLVHSDFDINHLTISKV